MRSEHLIPGALVSSREWPDPSWRARNPMMPSPVDPLCIIVERRPSSHWGMNAVNYAELLVIGSLSGVRVHHLTYEKINWHLILERGAPGNIPKKRGRYD